MNVTVQPAPDVVAALGIAQLSVMGNPAWLDTVALAVVGSVRCPATILLAVHDLAQGWRRDGIGVISGFASPVEDEVWAVLRRGQGPLVRCLARGMRTKLAKGEREALAAGRLALVSPFADTVTRQTEKTALQRNEVVAALAPAVLIPYAAPGGKTWTLAQQWLATGRRVLTVDSSHTVDLQALGAEVMAG